MALQPNRHFRIHIVVVGRPDLYAGAEKDIVTDRESTLRLEEIIKSNTHMVAEFQSFYRAESSACHDPNVHSAALHMLAHKARTELVAELTGDVLHEIIQEVPPLTRVHDIPPEASKEARKADGLGHRVVLGVGGSEPDWLPRVSRNAPNASKRR